MDTAFFVTPPLLAFGSEGRTFPIGKRQTGKNYLGSINWVELLGVFGPLVCE
jgi:hypothetical protein